MKNKQKKKVHIDKKGREFTKEVYFVGGKMKFHRTYVTCDVPVDQFYEENATDLDFFLNGDYELIRGEMDSNEQSNNAPDLSYNEDAYDLPF